MEKTSYTAGGSADGGFTPRHGFFVGVDSDGCVFDTMGVKQREHFHPLIRRFWGLEALSDELLKAVEFVNLRSKWRGQNRFPCLLRVFDVLSGLPGVRESGVGLPDTAALRGFVESGLPLDNAALRDEARRTGSPELRRLLDWSLAINADIAANMRPVEPFAGVVRALEVLNERCDLLVVSQTPEQALEQEWETHGLMYLVRGIAGQESGRKADSLRWAATERYDPRNCLMLGDAPGDADAAREAGVLFYPVIPEREVESWERLVAEAAPRFFAGSFAGEYERSLATEFEDALLDTP